MQNINRKIRVAITHGDMNGVGYELILRSFAEAEMLELMTPIIYGSRRAVEFQAKALLIKCSFNFISDAEQAKDDALNFVTCVRDDLRVEFGKVAEEMGMASRQAIDCAMHDYARGLFDVLVMAPSNDDDVLQVVDYLRAMAEEARENAAEGEKPALTLNDITPLRVMRNEYMHVACVLGDVDDAATDASLTTESVADCAGIFFRAMHRELRIDNPRIAILALNEHITGDESSAEIRAIAPAISQLVNSGKQAFGPYKAKEFFESGEFAHFDGVLAMNLGQALVPFDELFEEIGCMYVTGLPLITALPMHGPCYDMAGQGVIDEGAFRKALYLAVDTFRNRFHYDQAVQNPLPKMYHERKEDGEKARFAVRKKFDFEKKGE